MQGPKAELRLEKPSPAQVDGDVLGETRHIEITIEPRALCVRVPQKDMS
jgi:diacylglycerol kinase family enzyme